MSSFDNASSLTLTIKIPARPNIVVSLEKNAFDTATVSDLKTKICTISTESGSEIPVEQQKLIYSGKLLKDPELLKDLGIKDKHSLHLVISRGTSSGSGGTTESGTPSSNLVTSNVSSTGNATGGDTAASTPSGLPPLPTGTLLSALTAGNPTAAAAGNNNAAAGSAGLGGGIASLMSNMLQDPTAMEAMRAMQPPGMPQLTPEQMREALQSPLFQAMLSNPELLRQMMLSVGGMGGPMGGVGGMGMGGMFGGQGNANAAPGSNTAGGLFNPELLAQLMGGAAGAARGVGNPNLPPEQLYERELAQLQEMG
jgi:ubiquilin